MAICDHRAITRNEERSGGFNQSIPNASTPQAMPKINRIALGMSGYTQATVHVLKKMQERKYKNTKIQNLEKIANENWHHQAELSLIEQELCFRSSKRSIVLLRATQKRLAERGNLETISPHSETEEPSLPGFTRRVFGDDRPLRAGWIYFFEAVGQDLFKIGRTRKGPQTRAKASDDVSARS